MAGTGFLNGRYAVKKDGRTYVLSHANASCEQVKFFSAGTYTIVLSPDTVSVTVGLVGAGGAAGQGHFHKPDIFSTYWGTPGSGGGGSWIQYTFSNEELREASSMELTVGSGGNTYRAAGGDTVLSVGGIVLTAGGGKGGNDGQGDGGSNGYGGAGGTASYIPETLQRVSLRNGNPGKTGVYPTGGNPQGVYDGGAGQALNAELYGKGGMNGGYGIYNVPGTGSGADGAAFIILHKERR